MLTNLRTILLEWGWPTVAQFYLFITIIALLGIVIIEPNPIFYRSIWRMITTGIVLGLLKSIATIATFLALLLLPYERLRLVILGSLIICGGLTLAREWVTRLKSGDQSPSSYIGGFFVALQTVSFILLVSSGIALFIEALLAPARILESDMGFIGAVRGWIEVLATLLALVTVYYLGFTLVRRILGVTGFSWVDPPNWRTLFPHLKYIVGPRLGWPPWQESTLADTVRAVYVKQIVGSNKLDEIIQAARIEPIDDPQNGFTFAILGDPGEGDLSQIRLMLGEPNISRAIQQSDGPYDPPGFVIISSDIVYPAGELMDYERTVYRPYTSSEAPQRPLWYGIPGNHDWYNNLKGMFLNFGYPTAHSHLTTEPYTRWKAGMRSGPWARYGFFSAKLRWAEVAALRKRYHLPTLGGDPLRPETQQRLPYWEMAFDKAPLIILGVDTGSVGSLDETQRNWLLDRLRSAKAQRKIIMMILSEPMYVDGTFGGGQHLRELYALIRTFNVHVVMGGDTHAYQHYSVKYCDCEHTTHHFVNGGGGAFLSPPIDLRWDEALPLRPDKLVWTFKDQAHGIDDQVTLLDFYPTADQLREKFSQHNETGIRGSLRQFEATLLQKGFTTALDHDRPPLFQSFVTCSLMQQADRWFLRITPWFTNGPGSTLQPQEPIDIFAPEPQQAPNDILYTAG